MSKENKLKLLPTVQELKSILDKINMSPEVATTFVRHISSRQLRRWLTGESIPSKIYQREITKGLKRLKKLRKT